MRGSCERVQGRCILRRSRLLLLGTLVSGGWRADRSWRARLCLWKGNSAESRAEREGVASYENFAGFLGGKRSGSPG